MPFVALEVALELIRVLRVPLAKLRRADAALGAQAATAASSVPLNIAEGNRRAGRDRQHFFRIAAGSAAELQAALQVAAAWGYLTDEDLTVGRPILDRQLALLWGLTHRRA